MRLNIADRDFQTHTIRTIIHSRSDLISQGNFNICLKIGEHYLEHWENRNNRDGKNFIFRLGSIKKEDLRDSFQTNFPRHDRNYTYSPIYGIKDFNFLYKKPRHAIVFHASQLNLFYKFIFVRMGNLKYVCNDGFRIKYETSYSYYHKHFKPKF